MNNKCLSKLSAMFLSLGLLVGCSSNESTQGEAPKKEFAEDSTEQIVEAEVVNVSINIIIEEEKVEDYSHDYEVAYGFKLMDVMKEHYRMVEKDGFIQCIEGNRQNEKEGLFWFYYVNGEIGQVGAAEYELQEGDVIDWKLMIFE